MAIQNKTFEPPISSPPQKPPRTILQVDNQSEVSEWGAIPKIVPKPEGGVAVQKSIAGKSGES
jgi:hypothetical protein